MHVLVFIFLLISSVSTSTIDDDNTAQWVIENHQSEGEDDVSGQCGWDVPELFVSPKNDLDGYANYGEFPWMVALIKKSRSKIWSQNDYLGGGTLIHPSVVLTAPQKIDRLKAQQIKIRAGEWDTQMTKKTHPYQERDVKKIIVHPHFFKTSLYFAVALLILDSPFNLEDAPHIKTACIGREMPPPGTVCFSMGWDQDFTDGDKSSTKLKKIRLPLVGADDCTQKLRKSRLGRYFRLNSTLTCAGVEEGVNTCGGDSGAPLVCNYPTQTLGKRTRYVVYGVKAYRIDCGRMDRPNVYANIPALSEWIDEEMTKEEYGTALYTVENV